MRLSLPLALSLTFCLLGQDKPSKTPDAPSGPQQPTSRKVLEEGILPGSIRLPGTDMSLKVGGYVKVDFIQDFDYVGNQFQFKSDTIPVEGSPEADLGGRNTIHARETRLILDLQGPTSKGRFRAYVETDFYGDGNSLRIRHAFGEIGNVLGGQTWTTFQDISARPRTLDYEGPDAEIFVRQAMIRWTQPVSRNWKFGVAVEQSGSQFAIPPGYTGTATGNLPDIPAFLRYENSRGHFQVASIFRHLKFDGQSGSPDITTSGWGINSTFRVNTVGKSALMGQFVFGNGLGRYIESMAGQNVDAVFRGSSLKALPTRAWVVGYEQHWSAQLTSSFAYAAAFTSSDVGQPESTIRNTRDVRANLIWAPFKMLNFGGELILGRRENRNGARGDATRFQMAMIFNLN